MRTRPPPPTHTESLLFNLSGLGPRFPPLLQRYLRSFLFKVSLFSSIPKSAQQEARVTEVEVFKTVLFSTRGRLTSARRLYKTAYFSRLSLVKLFVFDLTPDFSFEGSLAPSFPKKRTIRKKAKVIMDKFDGLHFLGDFYKIGLHKQVIFSVSVG